MASDAPRVAPPHTDRNLLLDWLLDNTIRNPLRFVGLVFILGIAAIIIGNISSGRYGPDQFARQLIFGLAQGSIYALIALGYTLVYGILLMINFAHGEIFMAGAYIGFFAINAMEQSGFLFTNTFLALLITLFTGVLASVVVAFTLERIAYRPLRNAPRLVPLITAIGASITLQQLFLRLFGASTRRYPDVHFYIFPQLFNNLECN